MYTEANLNQYINIFKKFLIHYKYNSFKNISIQIMF